MSAEVWSGLWKKIQQYRYPALVLLLGLALALLPSARKTEAPAITQEDTQSADPTPWEDEAAYLHQTEQRLERVLSQISGAGQVRVMLTLRSSRASQYQSDYRTESETGADRTVSASEQKTVILGKGSAYDEPAVVKTEYPSFQGALIVCGGGENAQVRYAVIRAVSALLDLGTDEITVVKMK